MEKSSLLFFKLMPVFFIKRTQLAYMLWHFSAGVTSSLNYLANNLHKTKIIISLIELFQGEFFWF
jgi:hypothetical protein